MKRILTTYIIMCGIVPFTMAQQRHGNGLDDILQYTPYATVLTLKACGVDSRNDWPHLAVNTAMSFVMSAGITYSLKHTVREWRPDHSDRRSFPSGHATFTFAGATVLHHEFGHVSPWISIGGYSVATLTAADRVRRDRHHWYDVATGAAVGVLSTELTYFVTDRLFPRLSRKGDMKMAFTGNTLDVSVRF